jgi:hypothetical protein
VEKIRRTRHQEHSRRTDILERFGKHHDDEFWIRQIETQVPQDQEHGEIEKVRERFGKFFRKLRVGSERSHIRKETRFVFQSSVSKHARHLERAPKDANLVRPGHDGVGDEPRRRKL